MCGKFAAGDLTQAEMRALFDYFLKGTPLPESHPHYYRPTSDIAIIAQIDGNWFANAARWWFIPSWFNGELKYKIRF